jgi:hypothetical protein
LAKGGWEGFKEVIFKVIPITNQQMKAKTLLGYWCFGDW